MADQTTTIPKGWKMTTLGEVAEIIMGQSPSGESYNQNKDGLPFYQGITEFGDKYVDIKTYTNQPTKIIEENSILFSVRAPVGKINFTKHKACIGRGNAGLKMKNGQQDFLYFLLKKYEKAFLSNTTGTVFDSISGGQLRGFEILIPEDREEQRAIAAVLSSLDDKIELLREENKTLEAIAQAIFKEWFVNFNFPDSEGKPYKASGGKMIDSELGDIPDGWRVEVISNIFNFIKGIEPGSNNYSDKKLSDDYNPFYRVQDISQYGDIPNVYVSRKLLQEKTFNIDDILISLDGTIGRVFIGGSGGYSSGIRKVTGKNDSVKKSLIFCFLKSTRFQRELESFSRAETTIKHAGRAIENIKFALDENIYKKFGEIFDQFFQKIILNLSQIQTLSTLRDTLLTKLMKGEIRVKGFGE